MYCLKCNGDGAQEAQEAHKKMFATKTSARPFHPPDEYSHRIEMASSLFLHRLCLLAAGRTAKIRLDQPTGVGLISMLAITQAHSQSSAVKLARHNSYNF